MRKATSGFIKKAIGIHHQSGVRPLRDMKRIGSYLHHYHVPEHFIGPDSICYCIGAGEDISFDTELVTLYDCKVYIFDPTPYGIDHFTKLKEYTASGKELVISDGDDRFYSYDINFERLSTIEYVPVGVWDKRTILVFHDPQKQHYPSYSACFFTDSQ